MDAGELAKTSAEGTLLGIGFQELVVKEILTISYDFAFILCNKLRHVDNTEFQKLVQEVLASNTDQARQERSTGLPSTSDNIVNQIRRLAAQLETAAVSTAERFQQLTATQTEGALSQLDGITSATHPVNRYRNSNVYFTNVNTAVTIPGASDALNQSNAPTSMSVVQGDDGPNQPQRPPERSYNTRNLTTDQDIARALQKNNASQKSGSTSAAAAAATAANTS